VSEDYGTADNREGLKVLTEDSLPECKIASGYILARRIATKLIAAKGANDFLGAGGSIHVGVGCGFEETCDGLVRRDGKVVW